MLNRIRIVVSSNLRLIQTNFQKQNTKCQMKWRSWSKRGETPVIRNSDKDFNSAILAIVKEHAQTQFAIMIRYTIENQSNKPIHAHPCANFRSDNLDTILYSVFCKTKSHTVQQRGLLYYKKQERIPLSFKFRGTRTLKISTLDYASSGAKSVGLFAWILKWWFWTNCSLLSWSTSDAMFFWQSPRDLLFLVLCYWRWCLPYFFWEFS